MGGIYWLASYPKSGNTWFRAFLRNLQENGDAPVDINDIRIGSVASARYWLDEVLGFDTADLTPDEVERLRPAVYRWSARSGTVEYHKIHDAYTLTAQGEPVVSRDATRGAVYIVRNPLDVARSSASFWPYTIDETIASMGDSNTAMADTRARLSPQVRQRLLTWSGHVLSWVDAPGLRCEVVRYEDMLRDPLPTFTKAAAFLELPHDRDRVSKAIRFAEFGELARQEEKKGFRERPQHAQRFFDQGRSGSWRDTLTPNQVEAVVAAHGDVMRRFGYLDAGGNPV